MRSRLMLDYRILNINYSNTLTNVYGVEVKLA